MIDQMYRKTVLTVAGNKTVESVMRSRGWGLAQRFVAGHRADDIIQAVKDLQTDGIGGLLDLLGEFVDSPDTANAFAEQILSLVDQAAAAGIQPYITVKLSGLGQGLTVDGEDLGLTNARRILSRAKPHGGFLALDMEDHPRVDVTLAQFRSLVREFGNESVGTVLQSYLHRTEQDLADLADLEPNLRIVKGAYLEPESVAMQDKADINASYRRLVYANLKAGNYTNVASHDDGIIDDVKMFVLAHGIPREQFEFQLLYGVRRDLQKQLASEGYRVRAYIPYGNDWYPYFSRRIAERPSNALFVLRGMFGG